MAISVPVDAKIMFGGAKYCFAKFLDKTVVERIQNPDELCGHRDPLIDRKASGRRKVAFVTLTDLTVPFLEFLMPLIGMTDVSDTWTSNEVLTDTEIIADKVGAVHKYTNCKLAQCIIRAQGGTLPVSVECSWIAEDEIEDSGTTWVDGTVAHVFGFPGCVFEIATVEYAFDRFAFAINNKLIPSWNNSVTVTDIGPGPRQTLLATNVPYIVANKDLYWDHRDSVEAVVQSLALTNGYDIVTINLPATTYNPESPSIESSIEEIRLPMTWEANRQASVAAFNIVVDVVP